MNAYHEIRMTKAQIGPVLDALDHVLGADEQLKLDMLEGETTLNEVVSKLLAEVEDAEGLIEAVKGQIDVRKERVERLKHRVESIKGSIASLMDTALLTKLPLPEATLSLRTLQPKPKVVDADALPDAFVTIQQVRKPDLEAIAVAKEQGADIPGVVMTNGSSSLTVRRK